MNFTGDLFCFFMVLIYKGLSVINSCTLTCEKIVLVSSLYLHIIHILPRTMGCMEKYYYKIHTYRFHLSCHEADHLEKRGPNNHIALCNLSAIIPLTIRSHWIIFWRSPRSILHLPFVSVVLKSTCFPLGSDVTGVERSLARAIDPDN